MAKHNKQYNHTTTAQRAAAKGGKNDQMAASTPVKERKPLLLPSALIFFALVWLWAAWWYGDVLHIAREYSFWSADSRLMRFEQGVRMSWLWVVGRALLMSYKWKAVGGLLMAILLAVGSWLLGYCLRLPAKLRALQYIPAAAYMLGLTYIGFDAYFETETGRIFGLPLAFFTLTLLAAIVVRIVSRKPMNSFVRASKDESQLHNILLNATVCAITAASILLSVYLRPEVRVVASMQHSLEQQDWQAMQDCARKHADLSYRQIAAYYAISLVQTNQILEHLFDIRLDYDEPYLHGFNSNGNNGLNYYVQDCDYHAGLVETAIHHGMEQMTMNGPSIRTLKLLTKCALMRGEWEVAKKYFTILGRVPFESAFIDKYTPMLYHKDLIDADPEMANIRLTEPMNDIMENTLVQPIFLGYNARLYEGRSEQALYNSIAVSIYTKTMQDFIMRCQPLQNAEHPLPTSVAEALAIMSGKHPDIMQKYNGLELYRDRFANFVSMIQPYLKDRPAHARELFPDYKGYYGYYYFFGKLKATKKKKENEGTSNQGVN